MKLLILLSVTVAVVATAAVDPDDPGKAVEKRGLSDELEEYDFSDDDVAQDRAGVRHRRKKIHVRYPVKRVPVPIVKKVPVIVEKKVPVIVEKKIPVYIEKTVPVVVKKPVYIKKPVPVPVPVSVRIKTVIRS